MKRGALVVVAIGIGLATCSDPPSSSSKATKEQVQVRAMEPVSAAGDQELRMMLESGRLDDLRWPNFSDRSLR
jgi:hypothetical protein